MGSLVSFRNDDVGTGRQRLARYQDRVLLYDFVTYALAQGDLLSIILVTKGDVKGMGGSAADAGGVAVTGAIKLLRSANQAP